MRWKDRIIIALTSVKRFLKSFISSTIFPTILLGIVMLFRLLNLNIPNEFIAVSIMVLLVIVILRWSLEPKLNLIKEYKSLMIPLENLTTINKSTSVRQVVMNMLQNKRLEPFWVYYFDEKGKNIDASFHDLNAELEKLISNPYRLLYKNTLYIREKFKSLVGENKKLYEIFIEMINTESISKDTFSYEIIKKEHNDFYSTLKESRNRFAELKTDFVDEFFSPLPELRFPNKIVIY